MSAGGPFGSKPEPEPSPEQRPPAKKPQPSARSSINTSSASAIIGVVAIVVLGYIGVNTFLNVDKSPGGLAVGTKLPPFAAPLASSTVKEGTDANLDPKKACRIRGAQIFNVCQAQERGPVVLGFFVTRSSNCRDQITQLDRLARKYPSVQVVAVAVKGKRADVRKDIEKGGWTIPVVFDHDGAVGLTYGLAVCPQITFAGRDGRVLHVRVKKEPAADPIEPWLQRLANGDVAPTATPK